MQITRRQFLSYMSSSAAALGFSQVELQKAVELLAKDSSGSGTNCKVKVIWLSGQACSGCTMAFTDLISHPWPPTPVDPDGYDLGTIDDVLWPQLDVDTVDDVLLDVIDLDYHETIQAAAGDLAMDWLQPWNSPYLWPSEVGEDLDPDHHDYYVLIVEGSVPVTGLDPWGRSNATRTGERACTIGTVPTTQYPPPVGVPYSGAPAPLHGTEVTMYEAVNNIAAAANAVIAVGQCASYGGIPGAYSDTKELSPGEDRVPTNPNMSPYWNGAKSVQGATSLGFFGGGGKTDKLINVPGCPPHPDWIYGTIVRLILTLPPNNDPDDLILDANGRPTAYYGETIHGPGLCPRYDDYNNGYLASRLGDKGCLAAIGCYGVSTHSDCAKRGWNNSAFNFLDDAGLPGGYNSFCVRAGHPCIGCTEPGYPFKVNTNG